MAAVATILRRSASLVSPTALRNLSSRTICQASISTALDILPTSFPIAPFAPRYYSEISRRPTADNNLLRVIDTEIKAVKFDDSSASQPKHIPFQIEDVPGQQIITLSRNYEGEEINIKVSIPSVDEEEEGENSGDLSTIPLIATISKKGQPTLEFSISAFPDELNIEALYVKDPEKPEDDLNYEGPDFGDLDENLQDGFFKFLEVRGINAATTNFLFEYMMAKDDREYVSWLKKLKDFLVA